MRAGLSLSLSLARERMNQLRAKCNSNEEVGKRPIWSQIGAGVLLRIIPGRFLAASICLQGAARNGASPGSRRLTLMSKRGSFSWGRADIYIYIYSHWHKTRRRPLGKADQLCLQIAIRRPA